MSEATPQVFTWDAERSVMVPRRPNYACRVYVDGEEYRLGIVEERSANTHNHYFAALHEAWTNLPEHQAERFPTEEHLRKWALIKAGYYTNSDFVCASNAEAVRLAAYLRTIDDYSVTVVQGCAVNRLVAKSQSMRAMGAKDFQESKTKVLDIVAAMVGLDAPELSANTGKAA